MQTDQTWLFTDKNSRKTYIIDIEVPNSNNDGDRIHNKFYSDLPYEIKKLWKQDDVKIVPIVLSSTEIIPKNLKANLLITKLPLYGIYKNL